jgi:type VI secretion system secreted protein Hcp
MRLTRAGRMILCVGIAAALLPSVSAVAAMDAYMTIKGAKQGQIVGGSAKEAGTSKIQVSTVVHETLAPASAALAGRRMHGTVTVVREVDSASPKLALALASNETLSQVVILFPAGSSSDEKAAQEVELTDAAIAGIEKTGNTEKITLSYQKIEVSYVKGSKSATDDWSVPN